MADPERRPTSVPSGGDHQGAERRRRRRLARTVGAAVVVVLVLVFVVNNSQPVDVHFWGIHSHPRLIFVIVGCLLIGGVVGYVIGRPRRRSKQKPKA